MDIVATIGKYEKDGQTKYISRNVGKLIDTKNGQKLLMDASFNLAGCERTEDGKVWLSLFEPRDNNKKLTKPQTSTQDADSGSDVPF